MPLVGGPQMFGDKPVADWSSLVRFGKRREACSCDGEPAPILAVDILLSPGPVDLLLVKGDLEEGMEEGSETGAMEERFKWS